MSVKGMGHSWPGGASENVNKEEGNVNGINASHAIWDFFQRHALP